MGNNASPLNLWFRRERKLCHSRTNVVHGGTCIHTCWAITSRSTVHCGEWFGGEQESHMRKQNLFGGGVEKSSQLDSSLGAFIRNGLISTTRMKRPNRRAFVYFRIERWASEFGGAIYEASEKATGLVDLQTVSEWMLFFCTSHKSEQPKCLCNFLLKRKDLKRTGSTTLRFFATDALHWIIHKNEKRTETKHSSSLATRLWSSQEMLHYQANMIRSVRADIRLWRTKVTEELFLRGNFIWERVSQERCAHYWWREGAQDTIPHTRQNNWTL